MSNNFKKYRYLGQITIDIPKPWEPHLKTMYVALDKMSRPKFMPLFLLNFINDVWPSFGKKLISNISIQQIKQKFGALRIQGIFPEQAQEIVSRTESLCNNTCEFCGNTNTTHVMIKSWVRNLCTTCKEVKKNGTNN